MSGKRQKIIRKVVRSKVNSEWQGLLVHVKRMSLPLRIRMAWQIITKSEGDI